MLIKKDIKLIRSLKLKKHRQFNEMFVVEGRKSIHEFIDNGFHLIKLFSVNEKYFKGKAIKILKSDLKKISFLNNPDDHLALFKIPASKKIDYSNLILAFDNINDPGNLGTIIRTCDWFGIKDIICSKNSVDCFNPKVVQSAMGSLSRLNITYLDLENLISKQSLKTYGTFISGNPIYEFKNELKNGIIVFGNEANGISPKIEKLIEFKLTIPRSDDRLYPESLNLSSSVAIVLSELFRRNQ